MRLLPTACGCMSRKRKRGPGGPLSCQFGWWQVQDLNLRRLSRRFYRPAAKTL